MCSYDEAEPVVPMTKRLSSAKETKLFDPADGFAPIRNVYNATDATIAKRENQWWMYLGGKVADAEGIQLFSASLAPGAPLSASGWRLTPRSDDETRIALLSDQEISRAWDLKGGRHCPSYVKGWDPEQQQWVERIYYAGGAQNLWGPYTIGYLEWNGRKWVEQSSPVFVANEDWERGSVCEPNLIYAGGRWKMWYLAASHQDDYLVQGYAESPDGRSNWTKHKIFFPPEEKVFDFCVIPTPTGYEAVFSRVWLAKTPPPDTTGLWWCRSDTPSSELSDWSRPVQIMTAEDHGWHSGPWKPCFQYSEDDPNQMLVFFDGMYAKNEPGPFPYVFTCGCLEIPRPD